MLYSPHESTLQQLFLHSSYARYAAHHPSPVTLLRDRSPFEKKLDSIIFVVKNFKKVLGKTDERYEWFPDSDSARLWFNKQKFKNYTFLLKGSRGVRVEKIIGL